MTYKIVLIRHGESVWNKENLFTGWTDVDLSETGVQEAKDAGKLLKEQGWEFDVAFTSVLKRAIKTLWGVLGELGLEWLPVNRLWRLNERSYGALQGMNKAETAAKHGEAQVKIWRRSYDIPPPPLEGSDARHPAHDRRYAVHGVPADALPATESLKETVARVIPAWEGDIAPAIRAGKRVLIAAHGNSLRALVKFLDGIPESEIVELNIPTGIPLVYELDDSLKPIKSPLAIGPLSGYYLGDQEAIKAKINAVANQAAVKKE